MKFDHDITWVISSFGNAAKDARKSNNLSCATLAQELGISDRQLRRIENGGQHSSLDIFLKITLILQMYLDDVIYLPSDNTPSNTRSRLDRLINRLSEAELEVLYSTAKGLLAVRKR